MPKVWHEPSSTSLCVCMSSEGFDESTFVQALEPVLLAYAIITKSHLKDYM